MPALLFQPESPESGRILYLHERGKQTDAGANGPIERLVRNGNIVLAIDVRGTGETATTPWRSLVLHRSLDSWADAVKKDVTRNVLVNTVYGALKCYDLPELVDMFVPEKVTIREPLNSQGVPLAD